MSTAVRYISVNKNHRIEVREGGLTRYYPQFKRGETWQYYRDSKLNGWLWFVTELAAKKHVTR